MLKSDEDYVSQAQKGDESACEYILNKYKPMVRSVSRTYFLLGGDSDDIVQEGMIGLYRAVCSFSANEGASFTTYAGVCVRRQICTAIKTAARKKHQPLNDYVSLDSHENGTELFSDPESIIENNEWRENLYKEIEEKLSKFEKNVLKEYLRGGTYEEIGAIFGKETKSIDNAIQRIRKKIKGGKIMSSADVAFINTCKDILENGSWVKDETVRPKWADGTPAYTKKKFGVVNRYDLEKEFPLITIRPIKLSVAVDEILWIWQKKSNNIHDLNSHIWDLWADEEGSIGKAYGYQLGVKHQYKEGMFDQVDRVLYDLKNNRASRRIMTNLYNFADLHEMALYPCAYSMTFNVTDGRLCAILNQRSQDMLAANAFNVAQYAALVYMFAQVSGLVPGELVHVIADAHIYDRHIPIVEELIKREVYPAPKVELDKSITNFYDFTADSFKVENYQHGEKIGKIEMAI